MPRVPTYDSFQAQETPLPQARLDAPQFQDVAGKAMQQEGQGMVQAGGAMARVAADIQNEANTLRVDDALNKAREAALKLTYDKTAGYTNLKGINALERPDGKPLTEEYGGALETQISEIAGTLGNDAQRMAFQKHAGGLVTQFKGQTMAHEAQEFKTYSLSVSEGVQTTALREIGLNWNNPEVVNGAVERIRAETYRQAQLLGKSAEWQEAQARKLTSNGHKVALMSALEQNDPAYADSYLKKYSGQMDADDILAVRGHITKEMDARVGMQVSAEVVGKMQPRIQTSDAERAFNIAVGTESGGKQFDRNGAPLTSPKGAVGIAQVMPTTAPEAAKLAGLPWDENRYRTDADYNKALGMAYFQKQLQDNGGDLEKAWAAYNAGPGRVEKAVKAAKLAGVDPTFTGALYAGQGDPRDWRNHLPAETRAYITKNMREYESGAGQLKRPTFEEIDTELRADPRLANDPARYKIAREDAQRRFTEQTAAIKQREEEAVATAMRGVLQNGGRYSDLPINVRAALPPGKVDEVLGFAQKISKGDDTTSPLLYQKLSGDPSFLRNITDNQFFALRRELSESDFKHFSNERAKLTGAAPSGNGPGELNTSAIKSALDGRMQMLGIDPTPKDASSDAGRVGAIRKFVNDYFLAAQQDTGRKLDDREVTAHIDALFSKNATFRGFFSNSSGPMLAMQVGDIDGAMKDKIKDSFKRQGVDNPTDAQILTTYWTMQVKKK